MDRDVKTVQKKDIKSLSLSTTGLIQLGKVGKDSIKQKNKSSQIL